MVGRREALDLAVKASDNILCLLFPSAPLVKAMPFEVVSCSKKLKKIARTKQAMEGTFDYF